MTPTEELRRIARTLDGYADDLEGVQMYGPAIHERVRELYDAIERLEAGQ